MADELKHYLKENFQITLTSTQLDAVLALEGPICVISCPGSGKTTVTVIRLANLMVTGQISGQNILALTFSKAAAQDMNQRFAYLFPTLSHLIRFSTIHSFAYQIIRHYEQLTHQKFQFIDSLNTTTFSKKQLLANLYLQLTERYISEEELEIIISQIGLLKNLMIEPHHKEQIKPYIENDLDIFIQIFKKYENYKEANSLLDYDDLLTQAYQILLNHEGLRQYYQNQYTHIQVDEAQDISKIQSELIKLVALPHNNLFLVGDDDQSIYAFRGAYPEQLLAFQQTYPEALMIYMSENFRSSQNIVQASSTFIKNNKVRYDKDIHTSNPTFECPKFHHFNTDNEQFEYLVQRLKEIDDKKSIAILYRQNISAIPLLTLLTHHQIPFKLQEKNFSFFNHPIVKDILAFITLSKNERDVESFKRVAKVLYLSATVTNQILHQTESGFIDYLSRSISFKTGFQSTKVKQFKLNLPKLTTLEPDRSITYILKTLNYEDYLDKKGFLKEEKEERTYSQGLAVLETLRGIARQCHDHEDFFNHLKKLSQLSQSTSQNGVTFLTFHGSKGLEFDYVFMIDCMNEITPSATALSAQFSKDDKEYEEERRLFYVAMTRAKLELEILSSASKYNLLFNRSNFFKDLFQIVHPKPLEDEAEVKTTKTKQNRQPLTDFKKLFPLQLENYPIGTLVNHKKFGEGTIIHLENEIATIHFDDETRRISLRIAVENGNLEHIDSTFKKPLVSTLDE